MFKKVTKEENENKKNFKETAQEIKEKVKEKAPAVLKKIGKELIYIGISIVAGYAAVRLTGSKADISEDIISETEPEETANA